MIGALRKIEGRSAIPDAPTDLRPMYIDLAATGWLATHPPIADRIAALIEYAGGRDLQTTAGP
jgi:heat shock protein HtpX